MLYKLNYIACFLKFYLFARFVLLGEGFARLFCLILGSTILKIVFIRLL